MASLISEQKFLLCQPDFPNKSLSDLYYYNVANRLAQIIKDENLLDGWSEALHKTLALGLTGYLQDILTDSGIWRSFIEEHNRMYGSYLPFYATGDEYVPYELNEADVRFLVWYSLSLNDDERRVWNPMDSAILSASQRLHEYLDEVYEDQDAPMPDNYYIWRGLEVKNPEETDQIFHFGHWLFMHCYLMTPAFAMTLAQIMSEPDIMKGAEMDLLRTRLEDAMMEDPTGPLAYYIREWVYLILEGKMPPVAMQATAPEVTGAKEHPYYTRFMSATGGQPIKFFATYQELNRFFIDALGWDDTDNLPALKQSKNFVLLVNREKGMLCAREVAACIKMPGNPCYNKEVAEQRAMDLLTVRGLCPADLLHYIFEHNALPDAHFPGSDDYALVHNNRDFIARCYLQKYYRGD